MDDGKREEGKRESHVGLSLAEVRGVLGRARRRSVLRTVLVSVLSVLVLAAVAKVFDAMLLSRAANSLAPYVQAQLDVSQPDVYVGGVQWTWGLLGGQLQMQTFKMIGGVPIPWDTERYDFNIFGSISPWYGDYSPAPQIPTPNGMRLYDDQTEQRLMLFYDPHIRYAQRFHDLSQLSRIPPGDEVEIALSLNRDYTFAQVNAMLPRSVTPSWYWVDTYARTRGRHANPEPWPEYLVYGFARVPNAFEPSRTQTPAGFVQALREGMHGPWQGTYQQVYDAIAAGAGRVTAADIRIIGVVVTGTPAQLRALENRGFVRASTLGAVANPY
jgi:hypothetical protein